MALFNISATATAGAATSVASGTLHGVTSFTLKAQEGNTGRVYVGNASVDDTAIGYVAEAGFNWSSTERTPYFDLDSLHIDVDTNGEGVDIFGEAADA